MPNWNHIVREHLAVLRLPPEREIEIVEEQALHLEAAYEDALAAGLSAAEAEARALRSYDWRLLECELSRAERPLAARLREQVPWRPDNSPRRRLRMETLWQDVRFGARSLMKQPSFIALAVLTLSLGIGANTAIFSVVNTVLLRPLPYKGAERLVAVWEAQGKANQILFSPAEFLDYQTQNQSFTEIATYQTMSFSLTRQSEPEQLDELIVSTNFFSLLNIQAKRGHVF